ncbi:hypothetical protein SacmaDRAFT_2507 [Saccharomonospora marina XMU15]|uniref:DUF4396 domain-containing protein n=1 Tax=Saccharomonospora marina XMU15 TaxID=882083 RepID=H5WZL8_9PSEU|nr:DUF4396 domain-containing protein [Saccharomonospora marina]EHR50750.1 hypothetical protein SacmaDRAFT_2507 [Saccharomonospora marina XMU15]
MIEFGWLWFLAEPWFVLPFYGIGLLGAGWVIWDAYHVNTPLKPAMRWAWPVIVFFFGPIGLALYFFTARAPGIADIDDQDAKQERHNEYVLPSSFRRTTGSVIHCVGGDGVGIITAMIMARVFGLSFWWEWWFEYLVGYLFGTLIFQYKAMSMHASSWPQAIYMAFRGEWYSMLSVMAGMGLVMGLVTPLAVTEQPDPNTYAFWGFATLGLLVGFVLTYPMNWLEIKVGYKHGMGRA